MAVHPLFDEAVLDKLKAVADAIFAALPDEVTDAIVTMRPGPAGSESAVDFQYEYAGPRSVDAAIAAVNSAGSEFVATWLGTGHPMPAFRFTCRPDEAGRRLVTMEPMEQW